MPKAGHIRNIIEDQGTITYFSKNATGDIQAPSSGKKLRILDYFYYCTADITTELRFKTSTNVIAGLPAKGAVGMNRLGRKGHEGAADEVIEIYLSGAGTVKGWISWEQF